MKNREELTLAFVSSAYNEAENLEELYYRCRDIHYRIQQELDMGTRNIDLRFSFVVADNCSTDSSLVVLEKLYSQDAEITVIANQANYGAENSCVNAMKQVTECQLILLLSSDLQDPPELALEMVMTLIENPNNDAVIATKSRSAGALLLRVARKLYYILLGYSSRRGVVPNGFHGFGCYRLPVINNVISQWEQTDQSMRQCLINSCNNPSLISYKQPDRHKGISSYQGLNYLQEGVRSIVSGDAAASRLALLLGTTGLILALVLAIIIVANIAFGQSGYGQGIPTVMGLVIISFTAQMLMLSVLSRQIESNRIGGIRPKINFKLFGARQASKIL
jgi:glycosyltransferase involved in cell wall biosynthesis